MNFRFLLLLIDSSLSRNDIVHFCLDWTVNECFKGLSSAQERYWSWLEEGIDGMKGEETRRFSSLCDDRW